MSLFNHGHVRGLESDGGERMQREAIKGPGANTPVRSKGKDHGGC